MNTLICEVCGSTDFIKKDGFFECGKCGVKYSLDEAKKIMQGDEMSIKGTVSIDDAGDISNLYVLARRALRDRQIALANSYYYRLLEKKPFDWEPNFFIQYNNSTSPSQLGSKLPEILGYLKQQQLSDDEVIIAINCIADNCISFSKSYFIAFSKEYDEYLHHLGGIKRYKLETDNFISNSMQCVAMLYSLGDIIVQDYQAINNAAALSVWKVALGIHKTILNLNDIDNRLHSEATMAQYSDKFKQYDSANLYESSEQLHKDYYRKSNLVVFIETHKALLITLCVIFVLSALCSLPKYY